MGLEATCNITHKRKTFTAAVHFEGDHVLVRGVDVRLKIMVADLKSVAAKGEVLQLDFAGGPVQLALGEKAAAKWRDKILNPPSRLDKLGLKPGMAYWSKGEFDAEFRRSLGAAGVQAAGQADMLFIEVGSTAELEKAAEEGRGMGPQSAIWVVYPKGRNSPVTQDDVFRAMRGVGLVDTKVCGFNERLTALKFVVPVAKRGMPVK